MKNWCSWLLLVGMVACLVAPLAGCGFLDMITGVTKDSVTGQPVAPPPGSATPLGTVGNLLGLWIPWAGTALGALGTAWQQVRVKKYSAAATSVISGVERAFDLDNDGVISVEELKSALKITQQKAGTQLTVQSLLDLVKQNLLQK